MQNQSNASATPPWLRDDIEDIQPLYSSSNNAIGGVPQLNRPTETAIPAPKTTFVIWVLRFVTMMLCVLMAATAVIGIESINGVNTSGKLFVGTYMLFFATLLFIYEALQIKPVVWVDHMLRRNFGFLYGTMGKSFFIIFIAFLSFGLGDPQTLTMATGTSFALFGFLELGLYLKYPELFE
eukprot:gene14433-19369_t